MDIESGLHPVLQAQIEVLEKIASGEAFPESLAALFRLVEMQLPGLHASVFIRDENGRMADLHVSPSSPPDLLPVLELWQGADASCPPADAMAGRKAVFAADIGVSGDAEGVEGKPAAPYATWCLPLLDGRGRAAGAFCVHGHMADEPGAGQAGAMEQCARLAAMALSRYRSEAVLRGRDAQLSWFYDNLKDVMFEILVDTGGAFKFGRVNRSFLHATGLREDQVVGKPVGEVIPEPSYSLVLGKYRQAIREKRAVSWEEVTSYPAGQKIGEVRVAPVFDDTGRCAMLVGSVHDITERREMETRLHSSEEMYRLLYETSLDGIILMTEDSEYLRANPAAVELFGCENEEQLLAMGTGDRVPELQPNGRRSDIYAREMIDELGEGGSAYTQWTYRRKDGSRFDADVMFARIVLDGRPLVHITIRDITEKMETLGHLERITKLYAALSQCNQTIIHCDDEDDLLGRVCKIAVEFGGMRFAWIGMFDESTRLLRPVSSYGVGDRYLDGIEVSVDPDKDTGRGPGGNAFRAGRAVWCQDFMSDPRLAPWRDRARECGWHSIGAIPLRRKGKVVGVFFLYADEAHAFDEREKQLLTEMSDDISFGMGRIQDKREREQERQQLRRLSQVVQQSHNMVMITDTEGCVEYVNPAFERATGYAAEEVLGRNARLLKSDSAPIATFTDLWSRLKRGEAWQGEIVNRKKDGTEFINFIHVAPLYTDDAQVTHYLSVGEDVTEHRHAEWRVEYLANYDELTGLPNRVQLRQQFGYAISIVKRSNENLALMFVDLDHFKNINDALGHSIGDAVLKEVGRRLKAVLREEDVVCRLGGDEFILMLPQCGADAAAKVAGKVLEAIAEPCRIDKHEFVITASLGISVFPQDGADLETLSKNADMAMYLAKQQGRGCYRFFTEEMQVRTSRTMLVIGELRHAIKRDEFTIHYQPLVSGRRIIGVEALLRWINPKLGSVPPVEFIPAAEESGLIFEIGEWVLRSAITQAKAWADSGMQSLSLAVNLSPVQFRDEGFSGMVAQVLEETQFPPQLLELEITEGMAMLDPALAVRLTHGLNALGVRFSIDDFGTGYSSLSYLKKFNIHKLKIDQAFVRDLLVDTEDRTIVSTIINMARSLGLVVNAEGVENEGQYQFLADQGCEEMQGFYFSKPLPAPEFELFVQHWNGRDTQ